MAAARLIFSRLILVALTVCMLLPLPVPVSSTSLPSGGCHHCDSLQYGTYLGDASRTGPLNYERYTSLAGTGRLIAALPLSDLPACCSACASTMGCAFFRFFPPGFSPLPRGNRQCYLLKNGWPDSDNSNTALQPSYLGGRCNPRGRVTDDPHFVGAYGTAYDFNGQLDRAYCLVSDARLHINALLQGYEETGAVGGGQQQQKKIRSWIKELGVLWRDAHGVEHLLWIAARAGKEQRRAAGFLRGLSLDRLPLAVPAEVGDAVTGPGGLILQLTNQTQHGALDTDVFHLSIEGVLDADISARVAHPLLQRPGNAEAHLNLLVSSLGSCTAGIHGVLGQTYRQGGEREGRALAYSALAGLLRHPIAADGSDGLGFLDGEVSEYESTGVGNADCKFATAWTQAGE